MQLKRFILQLCRFILQLCTFILQLCRFILQLCRLILQLCRFIMQLCIFILQLCRFIMQLRRFILQLCRFILQLRRFILQLWVHSATLEVRYASFITYSGVEQADLCPRNVSRRRRVQPGSLGLLKVVSDELVKFLTEKLHFLWLTFSKCTLSKFSKSSLFKT